MAQKVRQDRIIHILEQQGFVTVRYLVEVLQYSTATVNRDLNALEQQGLVKRSYGGVEAVKKVHLPPLNMRLYYKQQEKRRIAEAAVSLIKSGDTVYLNGGTTVQYMVPFLQKLHDVRVITNSLRLAYELGDSPLEVICLGGEIIEHPHVLGGDLTAENAMRYRPDKMFFSVGCVSDRGYVGGDGLVYRIMLQNSTEAWLLTDRTKRSDDMKNVICDFSHLAGVISDFRFPKETVEKYKNVTFIALTDAKAVSEHECV